MASGDVTDGIPGYAVAVAGKTEVSLRHEVVIATFQTGEGQELGIDRVVQVTATADTEKISICTSQGAELIFLKISLKGGETVTLYPLDHP